MLSAPAAPDSHSLRLSVVTPLDVARACARVGARDVLAPAEQSVYEGLVAEQRRRDWLAGRIAVKRALRAALRERREHVPSYDSIMVVIDAVGAPRFTVADRPELGVRWNVSIAHDDGFAVAALACTARSGSVGVDLERERPLPARLLRYVLTPGEQKRLIAHADAPESTVALWTLKEAVVKAGCDHGSPSMREVELVRRGPARYGGRLVRHDGPSVCIRATVRTMDVHMVALATCRGIQAA